jgi:Holliday junction resolvase RusA-like endonuclease
MPVAVTLPLPPTVNHMYTHGRRGQKFLSENYRKWKKEAGMEILPYKRYFRDMYRPPYQYTVTFCFPDRRKRDADNRLKPLQDLVSEVFGFDDEEIWRGVFEKGEIDKNNPRCELTIWGEV